MLHFGSGRFHARLATEVDDGNPGRLEQDFALLRGEALGRRSGAAHDSVYGTNRLLVPATVQAASVDSNVEARDRDLRSKRFFDVERFPTLTFASAAISDVASNRGKVRGMLTMHGVSKEVVLDTEYLGKGKDPWGNTRYGFHAETKINRKDFGMTWNEVVEAGGVLVGDEVEIALDVEAVPAKP
ncbi:MAG TPA: YceI family protein [Thermoanaerobaculia bacterium]|jgi:hypothetical protein